MDGSVVRHLSPECINHRHIDCPIQRMSLKCDCLCHKIVGE